MEKVINIFLKDFIQNGTFGNIKIGQNVNDVINYFGKNYNKGVFENSYILQYGEFEFFFWNDNNKLYGIQNDSINYFEKMNNEIFNLDMCFFIRVLH